MTSWGIAALCLALPALALDADLIVINAAVRTMDPARPRAEAIAVRAGRIAAAGTNAEIRAHAGPATRIVDAGGRLVLPGFNDAHVHFLSGGFQLSNVDLRDADTPEEFSRRIGAFAARLPSGRWILGGNWDHENWPGSPLPTKEMVDRVASNHPVWIRRLDGHMALAGSSVLRLAGITRDTPDPPGGLIVRDPGGEPTGVLKDAAMDMVSRIVPEATWEEKLAAARAATDYAASLGVTSVHDLSAGTDVGVYQELLVRGELKTRIYAVSPLPAWERLARTGLRAPFGAPMLRVGGLKGFSDGSLGSTTALFFDQYLDEPGSRGLPSDQMLPEGAMLKRVVGADRAGLHVMIHAIGDRANHEVLSIYEQAARENGPRDRRFRIEHAQHVRRRDLPRFANGGVVASVQPYHIIDDGRWAEKRIGAERARTTYPFRQFLDLGVRLAFGSDWTVAPLNPLLGIYAAVTRRTLDGKRPDGWVPEEKISLSEALHAYTAGSAYAEFAEKEKGTLAPGKLADLVILSEDLFVIPPERIDGVRVLLTMVGGEIVFRDGL
ncbi:MAG: amidohydrolase [Bryobacterales bacterium]|nr:amidohydrolase [Bryobacterales bacterium]